MEAGQRQKQSRLPKSISRSNMQKSKALKDKLQRHISPPKHNNGLFTISRMTGFSLVLPDLSTEDKRLNDLVKKTLVDGETQTALEEARIINFCRTIRKLYSLRTVGDGNCLLYAVSMAIWGILDEAMLLRRLIYVSLVEDPQKTFYRRWRSERERLDNEVPEHFQLSKQQWLSEWDIVVQCAEDKKTARKHQLPFEPLEEIHIFVLANVIQRPIIVLSESVVKSLQGSLLGPNNFAGIYLPLLWDASHCVKTPIVLSYHNAHFTPLVNMSQVNDYSVSESVVPLVNSNLEPLYIHFLSSSEAKNANSVLQKYLNICEINWTKQDGLKLLLSARLEHKKIPDKYDLISDFILALKESIAEKTGESQQASKRQEQVHSALITEREERSSLCSSTRKGSMPSKGHSEKIQTINTKPDTGKCLNDHCSFAGSVEYGGYCYNCFLVVTKDDKFDDAEQKIEQPYEWQPSILNMRCQFVVRCENLASVYTYPYCHEHANGRQAASLTEKKGTGSENYQPSITDYQCHHPGCTYAASRNVFPFCHEHANEAKHAIFKEHLYKKLSPGTYKTPLTREMSESDVQLSILPTLCAFDNCENNASKKTFPYCHEHSHTHTNRREGRDHPAIGVPGSMKVLRQTKDTLKKTLSSLSLDMERMNVQRLDDGCLPVIYTNANTSKRCSFADCGLFTPPGQHYCSEHQIRLQAKTCCGVCCSNPAKNRYDGLCSKCWLEKSCTEEEEPAIPADLGLSSTAFEAAKSFEPSGNESPAQHSHARTIQGTKRCVGPDCLNKANPEKGGLCDDCYAVLSQQKLSKVSTEKAKDPGPTSCVSTGERSAELENPQGLNEHTAEDNKKDHRNTAERDDKEILLVLGDLVIIEEKVRSTSKRCSANGCQNYGNPANLGYCNSCYKR